MSKFQALKTGPNSMSGYGSYYVIDEHVSPKKPKPHKTFAPPGKVGKSFAEQICQKMFDDLNSGMEVEITTPGSDKIYCKDCDTFNSQSRTTCSNCGRNIFKKFTFHSAAEWKIDKWHIKLGGDITYGKKIISKQLKYIQPPYGLEKDDPHWIMFINTCWTLAPIAWCHLHKFKPWLLYAGQWRVYNERRQVRIAKLLATFHSRLLSFVSIKAKPPPTAPAPPTEEEGCVNEYDLECEICGDKFYECECEEEYDADHGSSI